MTLKTEIAANVAQVPVAVALLLAALFVGLTLLLAFWGKKRKARKRHRTFRRRAKFEWSYVWAAVIFVGFGAYFIFLGFDGK